MIITNTQNNFEQKYKLYWSGHAAKKQDGVGIAIEVDKGIGIEEINGELLLLMYCYMGATYELFVVMHLLKRILIHPKLFSTIN